MKKKAAKAKIAKPLKAWVRISYGAINIDFCPARTRREVTEFWCLSSNERIARVLITEIQR